LIFPRKVKMPFSPQRDGGTNVSLRTTFCLSRREFGAIRTVPHPPRTGALIDLRR
ncbi:MAG: hypothetical protein QOF56_2429, partial [Acidobacteriaceae bacterium]|nr:hypothetical protein [Acidobacteriaceae bacterium]